MRESLDTWHGLFWYMPLQIIQFSPLGLWVCRVSVISESHGALLSRSCAWFHSWCTNKEMAMNKYKNNMNGAIFLTPIIYKKCISWVFLLRFGLFSLFLRLTLFTHHMLLLLPPLSISGYLWKDPSKSRIITTFRVPVNWWYV